MNKYDPLGNYLLRLPEKQVEVVKCFKELEVILGAKLPPSAYVHRAWWANGRAGVHVNAKAWMGAGWRVDAVDFQNQRVRFTRQKPPVPGKPGNLPPAQGGQNADRNPRRTMFSANRPNRTVVVHKPECRLIPWGELDPCGCGGTGEHGNQRWYCENLITVDAIDEFMRGRHWALLLCDICFGGESNIDAMKEAKPIGPVEKQFHLEMIRLADFANEHGFGNRFRQMIEQQGAIQAAKKLLLRKVIQQGLYDLKKINALDQSMEALVIQERFQPLFTEAEIGEARRRLDELGY